MNKIQHEEIHNELAHLPKRHILAIDYHLIKVCDNGLKHTGNKIEDHARCGHVK